MLEFESFEMSGDRFYQDKTVMSLTEKGITLFRGKNYDASLDGKSSNGTGKTHLCEILFSFITGRSPRGVFKRCVTPTFNGTLKFKDHKGDHYSFSYTPSLPVNAWTITKNDVPIKVSHKPSDCQEKLQDIIGLSREDFGYFVFINQSSLDVLVKGAPKLKKEYLEGFFNIDTFYSQKFEIYNSKWKKIQDDIETIKSDRIRLDAVQESRKELPGEKWIILQIENCDDSILLIKDQISSFTDQQTTINRQIETWQEYHSLFTKLQGLDAACLQNEQDTLIKSKIELEHKAKNRLKLEVFLKSKFSPHQAKRPVCKEEQPPENRPDQKIITEKEIALNQMREKLRLKKQITSLVKELDSLKADVSESLDSLEAVKSDLYKKKAEMTDHLSLLRKGSDVCPTCRQPLTFILQGLSVEERRSAIESTLKDISAQEKECNEKMVIHSKALKIQQQLDVLQDQFSRFPNFGVRLSEAEGELVNLKDLSAWWTAYDREQEAESKWTVTNDLLTAEAASLGYPDILKEDHSDALRQISERLPIVSSGLKLFDRFSVLTEIVLQQKPITDLDSQAKILKEDITALLSRIESLNEFKGVLRTQLASHSSLKSQAEILEIKVARMAETESECNVLGLLNKFYSPTGFKVYELKKRCQKLIERCNVWSSLFFQESHTWSLSDDIDNLDFLIRPTKHHDILPFPISGLSKGETNRAYRVLLFSQLELIPPNKNTNLLILDEIEGHLDEAGMTAFCEVVLPKLRETFPNKTIIVISHQSSLQSGDIDHLWLAERKDRKTTLTVYPNYQRKQRA